MRPFLRFQTQIPCTFLLCYLLCLTSLRSIHAQQNPQPHFRNYSTEHGLPSPETYCFLQDSRGYLWIGTDNGAARFDGYRFQTYGAKEGLTNNVIFNIHEDAKGRIWFGSMTGEAFILEGDSIRPYRFNHLMDQYQGQFRIAHLRYLQPESETAYFELEPMGFLKIDSSGTSSLITTERSLSSLLLEIEGYEYGLKTRVGKYGMDQQNTALFEYEKENEVLLVELRSTQGRLHLELPYFTYPSCKFGFDAAQRLSNGNWLVMSCNHLFCLQDAEILWSIPFSFRTHEIYEERDQTIWFCGRKGGGLRRYADLHALRKNQYTLFLEGLSISNMDRTPRGELWVSTVEQGIFYCSDLELQTYDNRFGFSSDLVTAVTFKNEHTAFVGCKNGDIYEVDLELGQISFSLNHPFGYHNHELFYHSENQALWSNAAYLKNGQWNFVKGKHYVSQQWMDFRTSKLEKLHLNARGELLGSNQNGIYSIDIQRDTIIIDPHRYNMVERIFAVHTDQQQQLWVGNARGIFEFSDSSLVSPGIDHPAFHIRVEDIHEFPDGSLVFGTKGLGVIKWQRDNILQISTDDGLTSNMIEDVHVDEKGILWVGTLNGLNKVSFYPDGQPHVRQFTMANGLPTNEIPKIRSQRGQLWLCTPKGLVKFHEQEEEMVSNPPNIHTLLANGAYKSMETIQHLPYGQNNLEFQFLSINFQQHGQIPYRYRLTEDEAWKYTQTLTINYPKLSPDAYRFEVQSQNQDGYWSESATYTFEILPPWWQTWWARLLMIGLILGAFWGYLQRLKKEASIQQQITDLERSALQAQMNPHFIFNCLNSIQNFILQNERKQAVEYLSRFAQLVRHNLNASVQGKVSLGEELSLLDNYLALEQERFEHRFDYEISVDEALNQPFISFPPLLIQPYVENAIIHGLAQKEEQGKVEIHFSKDNGHLEVRIRDNGPGYDPAIPKPRSGQHKSVGMSITQKRLELLSEHRQERVSISTLNVDGQETGTEIHIFIELL